MTYTWKTDVREFWEWLNAFKAHGIDILNECSWGFDVREPVYRKELDKLPLNSIDLNAFSDKKHWLVDNHKPREFFRESLRTPSNEQTIQNDKR